MDKAKETQDTDTEERDETPKSEVEAPDEQKPAPQKTKKLLSEEEVQARLREAGRDAATLKKRQEELEAREKAIVDKEIEAKWQDVTREFGKEIAEKYRKKGLQPEDAAELLTGVVSKTVQPDDEPDSNKTIGGSTYTEARIAEMSMDEFKKIEDKLYKDAFAGKIKK